MTNAKKFFAILTVVFGFHEANAYEGKLTCKKLVGEGLTLPDSKLLEFCTPAYASCLGIGVLKKTIAAVKGGDTDITTRSMAELQNALSGTKASNNKYLITCELFFNAVIAAQTQAGGSLELKDIAGYSDK